MRDLAGGIFAGIIALLLLCGTTLPAGAQAAGSIATLSRPATAPVRIQREVPSDAILYLWIRSFTPPRRGTVQAIVSLARGTGEPVEIGRIAIYPSEPFTASGPAEERGYSFDATEALARLQTASGEFVVRVALESIDAQRPSDEARLAVARAELKARS